MTQSANAIPSPGPSSPAPPVELAAFVGIDWADQEHAVCLSVAGSTAREEFTVAHTPEKLAEFVAMLRTRFGGRAVGIALEQSRGGLIHKLMEYDFLVLYPVPPVTAKRYREAFAPSGAKDDPPDARLLHELLVHHRDRLRAWRPDPVVARQLGLWCEHRRRLVNQATGLQQQLIAALKAYDPQALDWAGETLATPLFAAKSGVRLSAALADAGGVAAGAPADGAGLLLWARWSARRCD
jgi:hypothetical protein